MRLCLAASVSLIGIAWAFVPVHAATGFGAPAEPPSTTDIATTQPTGAGTAPGGQAENALAGQAAGVTSDEEIVVTALRQQQSLLRTPAAVTFVSGDLLERQQVLDIRGIQNLVPAARFSVANTSTRIFIRGVGSQLDFYWIPETTAVNLNGSYIPRFATSGAFYDIDNVQVLPGPQGVLYGRSAGGGVVLVETRKPVISRSELIANAQYGNFDTVHADLAANLPVGDDFAVRLAGVYNRHNGYETFGLQSDDSYSVRASALYRPTTDLSFLLWGTLFQQTGKPTAGVYAPYLRSGHRWYIPPNDPVTGRDNTMGSRSNLKYAMGGYALGADLGPVAIDYVGSILHQSERSLRKLVGNDQILDNAQTQYVQNLHLTGNLAPVDWIIGVDWFLARSRYNSQLGPNRLGQIYPRIRQRSLSGFGQVTFHASDAARLVAGARYTHDSLHVNGTNIRCFGPCVFPPVTFDGSWNHLDLKGGLELDVAPRAMLYANVQTGYAPGTFNNVVANNATPPPGVSREVRPQTLLAYTAGLRSSLANGLFSLNLEAFHYRYRRLIIQSFVSSLNQLTLFNAPRATVYGVQLSSTFRPSDNDTLEANVAYTRGAYGAFQPTPTSRNLQGLQMSYTPTWTAALSYAHRFDFANGGNIDARVSSYISSSYWGNFDHSGGARQDSYSRTDAFITYTFPGARASIGAWIKNIEDDAVATSVNTSGYPPPYAAGGFLEAPRTYGISLGLRL